jgi:electron transfer flavoprotein alpha subunit
MAGRFVVSAATLPELQRMAQAARRLAGADGTVSAVAIAGEAGPLAPGDATAEVLTAGLAGLADDVTLFEGPGTFLRGDLWASALLDALGDDGEGLLLADAPAAREAVARAATARGASLASMCEELRRAEDGGFVATRSIYGGVAEGTITLAAPPIACLFTAGKFEGAPAGAPVPLERRGLAAPRHDIVHVGDEPVAKTVDLAGAAVVVSVGRGFAKAVDLALVDPLVERLGAELGCSRPIAEDFRWLPKERLVGLTGASVTADLYLALGISGQVQHLSGIKGARVVAAVNSDAKAPIGRNADYIVVGDLYKVVPALIDALDRLA